MSRQSDSEGAHEPSPAEPQLASALWIPPSAPGQTSQTKKSRSLATGHKKIDSAFEEGLRYGDISCISGESLTAAQELSQSLLVTHLLQSTDATATVIDTGLSLDLRKLHQAISSRMSGQESADKNAVQTLDRVKIMKVFDFIGLTECLTELRDDLEVEPLSKEPRTVTSRGPRGTISDSQDEEEMLDEPTSPPRATIPSKLTADTGIISNVVIIDNITQVVAPLLKSNYVQGQALLAVFMRSLFHLTREHGICTLVINETIANPNAKNDAPSIFSSCTLQPALGRAFTYTLDVHLLIHRMPSASEDGDRTAAVDNVFVVEVLHDRNGGRAGKWAPFILDDSGRLREFS